MSVEGWILLGLIAALMWFRSGINPSPSSWWE